jgi:hypothetical protein
LKNHELLKRIFLSIVTLTMLVPSIAAQQATAPAGVSASLVVTVEARHGSTLPELHREDVMVYEGHNRDQVTDWIPLQGDRAALELFILIDDGLNTSVDLQLNDLKKFIASQPPTAAIGIGYMRAGDVLVAQQPTTNHDQVVKALRIPLGERGISSSPYIAVSDLIKRWPTQPVRWEILMVSDGTDGLNGAGPTNPYLDQAIADAQKAGVIVYSIYAPRRGSYRS